MDSPDLLNLLRAYSALVPPKLLTFPADMPFTLVHDYILGSVLLNPHLAKYPPSAYYQHTFWRWAIGQLEALMGDSASIDQLCPHPEFRLMIFGSGLRTR